MKCVGEFIFRGLEKREAGEFVNERGQQVKYNASYVLKVDEKTDKGMSERCLKVDINNSVLVSKLQSLEVYRPIKLALDVNFYGNSVKIVPVDLIDSNNK